jgi:hypothetical protein
MTRDSIDANRPPIFVPGPGRIVRVASVLRPVGTGRKPTDSLTRRGGPVGPPADLGVGEWLPARKPVGLPSPLIWDWCRLGPMRTTPRLRCPRAESRGLPTVALRDYH